MTWEVFLLQTCLFADRQAFNPSGIDKSKNIIFEKLSVLMEKHIPVRE
jgi:hypothetical protein